MLRDIQEYPNVIHTGFVPNEEVFNYYCAADVVVLPYRTHMSASGPLSLALSYDRPFLISRNLCSMLNTEDIQQIMQDLEIDKEDIMFDMKKSGDLFEKIGELVCDKKRRSLLSTFSQRIKESRGWSKTSKKFLAVINA